MPVYNCEKTLAAAVQSILHQTYENWELLVMEDGSTDGTLAVARSFSDPRIRVCSNESHKGIVERLNEAVARSRGEYFARMDGDDVSYPERLERQVSYLERHPEIDLLGCGMVMFKDDGVAFGGRPAPQTHEQICRAPANGFHLAHATLMGPTSWFQAHPYDENIPRAEDQVLLLRSYETSRFACLGEILYGCREDCLLLRKTLVSRYGFSKGALREFCRRRKYITAATAVLKQIAKAHVDIFAVVTGLDYHVLTHRALPLPSRDIQRWTEVWRQVQEEGVQKAAGPKKSAQAGMPVPQRVGAKAGGT